MAGITSIKRIKCILQIALDDKEMEMGRFFTYRADDKSEADRLMKRFHERGCVGRLLIVCEEYKYDDYYFEGVE